MTLQCVKEDGIIPRVIRDLYKKVEILSKQYDRTYSVILFNGNSKIVDLLFLFGNLQRENI
jgi:hypothetical protein